MSRLLTIKTMVCILLQEFPATKQNRNQASFNGGITLTNGKVQCSKCNKQYSGRSALKRHMELHTGHFSHYCEKCRRGFNNNSNFQQYMRTHEGLKYQCEYCPKTFMSKKNHLYHLSSHTGEYRFFCEKCNKGFNNQNLYEKHLNSHEER